MDLRATVSTIEYGTASEPPTPSGTLPGPSMAASATDDGINARENPTNEDENRATFNLVDSSNPQSGGVSSSPINPNPGGDPMKEDTAKEHGASVEPEADSNDDGFIRLRAKVRELKRQAKEIHNVQALKAEWMELHSILGAQIDPSNPDHDEATVQQRADILLGLELSSRYHDEGLDLLFTDMPGDYRRKGNWKSFDYMKKFAKEAAINARPSPFLDGYVDPKFDLENPSFEFTRRRLRARYSYEREMEYLYAVQERYDAMRQEALEHERLKEEARRQKEAEEQEETWLRNYVAPQPEVQDSLPQSEPAQNDLDEARSQEDDEEESIPEIIYAKPNLNRVEWATFKLIRRLDVGSACVLDVLIGEPVITYDEIGIPIHQRPAAKKDDLSKDRKTAMRQLAPGQAPLPERIRINSRPLLQLLEKIHGESIDDIDGSFVMTRPFKTLSLYEEKIRDWYKRLADRYRVYAGNPEDDSKSTAENETQSESDWDELSNPLVTLRHLTCLIEFMDTDIKEKQNYLARERYQQVTFSDLWYLFRPGDEVIGKHGRQAYRILSVTSPRHRGVLPWAIYQHAYDTEEQSMCLHCVYVDFDGKRLGPVSEKFVIEAFDGERSIASLPLYPLHLTDSALRSKFIERGKKFLAMAAVKHMHCTGATLDTRDEVDSQVVIDFSEALSVSENREWRPKIEELLGNLPTAGTSKECTAECCRREAVHDDSYVDVKRNEQFMASLNPQDRTRMPSIAVYPRPLDDLSREENAVTDDELLIMSYRVFGFVLRTRKWAPLDLADLVDVRPQGGKMGDERETPFDKLVLPDGHKEMVQSLIAQHFRDKESGAGKNEQVDFVRGKGKGLILLLHGAPGVGKTTTAECVADLFHKPLFQITCGDLGHTAKDVEATLETNFALANRWGCILLLDEADVFLAARSPTDFQRNGLVAVFLRVLEYYAGILFLTTNRVGDFDEAFASRIHISLYYPPLKLESTTQVFQLNLDMINDRFRRRGRTLTIDKQILKFARQHYEENPKARWNGRQIRNACQTALALAEFEAQGGKHDAVVDAGAEVRLLKKHFETVANAYLEFTQYLKDIFGTDAEQRAHENHLRAQPNESEDMNPLLSYNSKNSQAVPFNNYPSSIQQGYPAGLVGQSQGSSYPSQFYQAPIQAQVPPHLVHGGAASYTHKVPLQGQQPAYSALNFNSHGSFNNQGEPHLHGTVPWGQPNVSATQYQGPPGAPAT